MDILELSSFQTLTGQDLRKTRSTSRYCVFVGGNLVSWKSKKQSVVLRSSAESEYRAMTQSVCEIMWIRQLLMEVGIETSLLVKLWCDKQATMHITV